MPNLYVRPVAVLLAAACCCFRLRGSSSRQKPADDISPTIQVEVNLVNLLASVRDKHGALISNLSKDDFTLTEDGQPQEIKYFTRETDLPLTIGLLVDVSGSQRNLIEIEREAAYQFFSQVLRKKDMAFLISFGAEAELLQDFTSSPRLLQAGLDRLRENSGSRRPASRTGADGRRNRAERCSTTPCTWRRPTGWRTKWAAKPWC